MKWSPFIPAAALLLLVGCEKSDAPPVVETNEVTTQAEEKPKRPTFWSDLTLHKAIREKNPDYTGNGVFQITPQGVPVAIGLAKCEIVSLEPLEGLPLQELDLSGNPISDLSPLKGMPLVNLFLEDTEVENLTGLEGNTTLDQIYLSRTPIKSLKGLSGLPITQFNAVDSHVSDLGPLRGAPLRMVWLTGTPVTDIEPLSQSPMESLTLHRTPITDLSPLAGTQLQRLHIGETPVTDLTPLAGLPLTRLVFDITKIEKGLEVIQAMPTLRELGSAYDDEKKDLVPTPAFWAAQEAAE